jgi:drug/metabolite transporter (DMT)-like permease
LKSPKVILALVLVQVLFATLPVAVKVALRDLSSPALALLRVTGAAALFLVLQRTIVRERIHSLRDYGLLAVYSLFGVIANQLLYITALTLTTATAAQTLVAAGPAMTLLVAILLRKETATRAKWLGIALAASGALMLVGVHEGSVAGNLLALCNVASYSIYLVISRGLLKRYNALTVITWVFAFGVLGMLPWGLLPAIRETGGMSGTTWAAMAYIIVGPTVAAYYLNLWASRKVEASLVSTFVYIQPVMTALLAVPLLHERISPMMLPAVALIFAGVWVAIRSGRSRRSPTPSPEDQEVVEP